jgi:hypothetical protein
VASKSANVRSTVSVQRGMVHNTLI